MAISNSGRPTIARRLTNKRLMSTPVVQAKVTMMGLAAE